MADQQLQAGRQGLLRLLSEVHDIPTMEHLFRLMFTKEEQRALAHRYLIVGELIQSVKSQRAISADLQVSISKITRGSTSLKEADDEFKKILLQHYTKPDA